MRSAELYKQLRLALGPWFKSAGFRRAPRTSLGWYRQVDAGVLLVWFQVDKWGWDKHAGSGFFVNFQVGPVPKSWSGRMERLPYFLSDAELEEVRAIQNGVIARLTPPPAEHVELLRREWTRLHPNMATELLDAHLAAFTPVTEPYRRTRDFTLRYYDAADVDRWAAFLQGVCPGVVSQLAHGFPTAGE